MSSPRRQRKHLHHHHYATETAASANRIITCYASSSDRVPLPHQQAAYALGREIARRGWVQRNGGGRHGLMGSLTDGGLDAGGAVDAVILDVFTEHNCHPRLERVQVVADMGERKHGLYREADAYIALPGGLGTLEELAEVLSWRQLAFHNKPIVLYNVDGFWDPLMCWLERAVALNMVSTDMVSRQLVQCADSAAEVCRLLDAHFAAGLVSTEPCHPCSARIATVRPPTSTTGPEEAGDGASRAPCKTDPGWLAAADAQHYPVRADWTTLTLAKESER